MSEERHVELPTFVKSKERLAAYKQASHQNAMLHQRAVKLQDFPINNRAARRRLAKGFKPGQE